MSLLPRSFKFIFGSRTLRRRASFVGLSVVCIFILSCGRPATESECKKIIRAALKAELQEHYSSPKMVEQELPRLEAESMESLLPKCLGQRIKDEQLRCIDRAEAGDVAFEDCL